jgi:hypothetical protein
VERLLELELARRVEGRTRMRRAEREDGEQQQQRVADEGDGQCHGAPSCRREPNKIAPRLVTLRRLGDEGKASLTAEEEGW